MYTFKEISILMDWETGLMHVHSVLSVLNLTACNFPSCHCGVVIKEAIWTVNILAYNQPPPPLLTNINHFIYSQEVTSCIWQVITSVCVCLRVCACVQVVVHLRAHHWRPCMRIHAYVSHMTCGALHSNPECNEQYSVHLSPSFSVSFTFGYL